MTLSLDRQNALRAQYQARHPGWRPATEIYEQAIRARLQVGLRVLDLGCGRGGVLEQLGDAVSQPIGCDPDLPSLREHRLPGLPRAAALADALPFRDDSIDIVVCSWVLEHVANPKKVFQEVERVLKPGGCFIFLTPNAVSLVARLNRLLHAFQGTLVPRLYGRAEVDTFPVQYRANTPWEIGKLTQHSRLRPDLIRGIEDPTYLAFTPFLFGLSIFLSRITPPVHLIGVLSKA